MAGLRAWLPAVVAILLLWAPAAPSLAEPLAAAPSAGGSSDTETDALEEVHPTAEKRALDEALQPFPGRDPRLETREAEQEDVCDWELDGLEAQEATHDVVYGMTCHTFRWFDSLWGSEHDFKEEGVNGLLLAGTRWSEYYDLDPRFRLKARAQLPNMSRRWDLILGRVDEEAFVSDTQGQDRTFYNPAAVDRGEDAEWLLGLGHRGKERKSGWDYSVGVRLRVPPRPYTKAQWYYNKDLTENSDFRFRQTFFWRSDRGFGVTSRGDLAWSVSERNVLRLEAFGTKHDDTRGVQWYAGHTWYHLFRQSDAFSLRSFVRGETDAEVEVQEYGFDMIWRRPFTREWIYLSVGPSVTWPRELAAEEREINFGFNLWLEMEFGDWTY